MPTKSFNLILQKKISSFKKEIKVDSDKSISIRSMLIGAISENISSVSNVLESEDVISAIKCLRKLGVTIRKKKGRYFIYGKGLGSLTLKKDTVLNFGNSGTLARLLIGILSTTPDIQVNIKGDHSLNKRSMKKLIELMSSFGAIFLPKKKYTFPLKLISTALPICIKYKAYESAQLKSAVILAALNAHGRTEIIEQIKSRDHTENMLLENSHLIKIKKLKKKTINVIGKKFLKPIHIKVSGDPSSAAFFIALTILNKNSSLKIKNVGLNPTRTGFYDLLRKHGVKIKFDNLKKECGELKGDIIVKSCKIKPIKAPGYFYSRMVDEYPILFVIAALTKGISVFNNVSGLKSKESNRITEMQKVLKQIGVKTVLSKNQLKIFGKDVINATNKKIRIPNLGDHRICMSSFVLACITGAKAYIKNFETVNTSSPSFLKIMKFLGVKFDIKKI